MAIDPDAIDEPGTFEARMETEFDLITESRAAPGTPGRILVPGEPEAEAERRSAERGVVMDREHHQTLEALGDRAGTPFPATSAIGD